MIHETAIVHPSAELADDVEIGPYAVIGEAVTLGSGCWIGPHAVLNGPTSMGDNNRIFQFCSIGEAPQDLKYAGEPTRLEVGSGNSFREYATVNRGTVGGGGVTVIGNDNLFMGYTHIAHDCIIGSNVVMANAAQLAGHVEIADFAILGGFTTVQQFTQIGEHAFTGMSTAIAKDVPPFVIVAGNLAKAYGINKIGLRRRGFDEPTIAALYQAFKALLHRRGPREVAARELQPLCEQYPEVRRFTDFIVNSERGVVR